MLRIRGRYFQMLQTLSRRHRRPSSRQAVIAEGGPQTGTSTVCAVQSRIHGWRNIPCPTPNTGQTLLSTPPLGFSVCILSSAIDYTVDGMQWPASGNWVSIPALMMVAGPSNPLPGFDQTWARAARESVAIPGAQNTLPAGRRRNAVPGRLQIRAGPLQKCLNVLQQVPSPLFMLSSQLLSVRAARFMVLQLVSKRYRRGLYAHR